MSASAEHRPSSTSTTGYADGLGARSIRFDRVLGTALECLQVRPELRPFEDTLLQQACVVTDLADPRFMRVRSIEREHGRLVVISELAAADRLSDIIEARAAGAGEASGIDAAFGFLLKALPALARLHETSIVHGTVAPGRVLLTGAGEIILADAIYSTALPRLGLSRGRLWKELHVLYPADPTGAYSQADVSQAALCALQVVIGRHMDMDEPLQALRSLLDEAAALGEKRGGQALAKDLRKLFEALLPLSGQPTQLTAKDATGQAAAIASGELGEDACAGALKGLLRYEAVIERSGPGLAATKLRVAPTPQAAPAPQAAPVAPTLAMKPEPAARNADEPAPARVVSPSDDVKSVAERQMFGSVASDNDAQVAGDAAALAQRVLATVKGAPASWKIAAALAIVAATGIYAGRGYLRGNTGVRVDAPVVTTPPPPVEPAAAPVVAAATTGVVTVTTEPAGAKVLVDGVAAGETPLRLEAVTPGRHTITVVAESATVKRTIRVEAGKLAAVDIPVFSGWIAVQAPIALDVAEGGRSLGRSDDARILLTPGRHTITLSNRDLGYSSDHTVNIAAGAQAVLSVAPTGRVNLNAQPWAEVWIDGARAGETPLANLEVPLGTRQFVFRHPQYGERKVTAKVSTSPTALTVDLTKPQ